MQIGIGTLQTYFLYDVCGFLKEMYILKSTILKGMDKLFIFILASFSTRCVRKKQRKNHSNSMRTYQTPFSFSLRIHCILLVFFGFFNFFFFWHNIEMGIDVFEKRMSQGIIVDECSKVYKSV